ncbi:MAG: hypothetical protein WCH34_12165 [Bacteroidota bacterium]
METKPDKFKVTEKELLDDLKRVANEFGNRIISKAEYLENGRYTIRDFNDRFGSWTKSKEIAGLKVILLAKITKDDLIEDVKKVAEELKTENLTREAYLANGKYSKQLIQNMFGTWSNLAMRVGFDMTRTKKYSDSELLNNIIEVAAELGVNDLTLKQYKAKGLYSIEMLKKHFGSWEKAKAKAGLKKRASLTKEEIQEDIRKVAESLGSEELSLIKYLKKGKFSFRIVKREFGSWAKVKDSLGLVKFGISSEEMLDDLKKVAESIKANNLIMKQYDKLGKYKARKLLSRFGSWNKALDLAGMKIEAKKISDDELIEDIKRVANIIGQKKYKLNDYENLGKYSRKTVQTRFGTWENTLIKTNLQEFHEVSKENILNDIKNVIQNFDLETITLEIYLDKGKFSHIKIKKIFGNWSKAKDSLGIVFPKSYWRVKSDELLNDLKKVAELLGGKYMIGTVYRKFGKYSVSTFTYRFGSWMKALELIGLQRPHQRITDDQILDDVKRVAQLIEDDNFSLKIYHQLGKHSHPLLRSRFGRWSNVLAKIGRSNTFIRRVDIWDDIQKVANNSDSEVLSLEEYLIKGKFSQDDIEKKFGNWDNAQNNKIIQNYKPLVNYSSEILLEDLKRVSQLLTTNDLYTTEYSRFGKYNLKTISRYFGSWKNVKELIRTKNEPQDISDDEILEDVKRVADLVGLEKYTAAKYKHFGRYSLNRVIFKFGSWKKIMKLIWAKNAIPIPKEDIFADILRIANGKKFLKFKDYQNSGKYSIFDIRQVFGSWHNAVMAFKLNYNIPTEISEEMILENIKLVANGRKSLTIKEFVKDGKYSYFNIKITFGSWAKAKKLAGLDEKIIYHKYTDQEYIDDLKRVASKLGKNHLKTIDYKEYGKYNFNSIITRFGTWNNSLEKAGLNIIKGIRFTREELIDDLKKASDNGLKWLTFKEYQKSGKFKFTNYFKEFGTWLNAKKAAGLGNKKPMEATEEQLIEDLKKVAQMLGKDRVTVREYQEFGTYEAYPYYRTFNKWENALNKSGLNIIDKIHISKEELIDELRRVSGINQHYVSLKKYNQSGKYKTNKYYYHFGTWENAQKMAGLIKKQDVVATEEQMIDDLKNVAKMLGRNHVKAQEYEELGKYFKKHLIKKYRSWNNTLIKAGLEITNEISITREELIEDLRKVSNNDLMWLTYKEYQKSGKFKFAIYIAEFGTWKNAKKMAGLRINKENKATAEQMIDDIKNVARILRMNYVSEAEYHKFGKYPTRFPIIKFGSWNNALEKSGLEIKESIRTKRSALIDDLRRVAGNELMWMNYKEYKTSGKFNFNDFLEEFGSWKNAQFMSGLRKMEKTLANEELILDDLKKVAQKLETNKFRLADYVRYGKYNLKTIALHFGTWNKAKEKAGLRKSK